MKALGLFGGGLDSLLACRWMKRQAVEIECVHFRTGFIKGARGRLAARWPGVATIDVAGDYLREVVLDPKYGFGSGMNPCIDCRIFMLRRAERIARSRGIELLFTGEVVGQRAMDQSRHALETVEREAAVEGRVLRPLSAALLPATRAEREGRLVLTERLRLHGRPRRAQLGLARELGLTELPTPSGRCCRLADPAFARRLRDLVSHSAASGPSDQQVELLDRGRHFRIAWNLKLIVGRTEEECRWLQQRAGESWWCQVSDRRGALGLLDGSPREGQFAIVAAVLARYSGHRSEEIVDVEICRGNRRRLLRCAAVRDADLARWRI